MKGYDLIKKHQNEIQVIASEHGAINLRVFGSTARGDDTQTSDLDFVTRLADGRSLYDLIGLKNDLQALLNKPVDIVTEDSLHWSIKDHILAESISVHDE